VRVIHGQSSFVNWVNCFHSCGLKTILYCKPWSCFALCSWLSADSSTCSCPSHTRCNEYYFVCSYQLYLTIFRCWWTH
jgi:hypothetical protein